MPMLSIFLLPDRRSVLKFVSNPGGRGRGEIKIGWELTVLFLPTFSPQSTAGTTLPAQDKRK